MNMLAQYLHAKKVNQVAFAQRIGCTQATVSRLLNGKHQPTFDLAKKIEAETDGEVPAANWPAFARIAAAMQVNEARS